MPVNRGNESKKALDSASQRAGTLFTRRIPSLPYTERLKSSLSPTDLNTLRILMIKLNTLKNKARYSPSFTKEATNDVLEMSKHISDPNSIKILDTTLKKLLATSPASIRGIIIKQIFSSISDREITNEFRKSLVSIIGKRLLFDRDATLRFSSAYSLTFLIRSNFSTREIKSRIINIFKESLEKEEDPQIRGLVISSLCQFVLSKSTPKDLHSTASAILPNALTDYRIPAESRDTINQTLERVRE